jgi:hypothetical protein
MVVPPTANDAPHGSADALARAYRDGAREGPSPALDSIILAAAARTAHERRDAAYRAPRQRSAWLPRIGLGFAAGIAGLLAFNIYLTDPAGVSMQAERSIERPVVPAEVAPGSPSPATDRVGQAAMPDPAAVTPTSVPESQAASSAPLAKVAQAPGPTGAKEALAKPLASKTFESPAELPSGQPEATASPSTVAPSVVATAPPAPPAPPAPLAPPPFPAAAAPATSAVVPAPGRRALDASDGVNARAPAAVASAAQAPASATAEPTVSSVSDVPGFARAKQTREGAVANGVGQRGLTGAAPVTIESCIADMRRLKNVADREASAVQRLAEQCRERFPEGEWPLDIASWIVRQP